jgi:hypothetical protein
VPPYEEIVKENHSLKEVNAVLRGQLEWCQRDKYGPGKSETLERAQIMMKLEGLTRPPELKTETLTYERTKPSGEKASFAGPDVCSPASQGNGRDRAGGGDGGAGRV